MVNASSNADVPDRTDADHLGHAAAAAGSLRRADGETYRWDGGTGPSHSIVAFSAICAHKLAYPTREVSFIRYQPERSATSDGNVIHCCADHSVYDPAAGARVVSGPAPQPLAAILLDYDAERQELISRAAGLAYPIRDGIPIMLPEEARKLDGC